MALHYKRRYRPDKWVSRRPGSSKNKRRVKRRRSIGESSHVEADDDSDGALNQDLNYQASPEEDESPSDESYYTDAIYSPTACQGQEAKSETFFRGCHFYIDGVVRPYEPFLLLEPCENAALHAHEKLVQLIVLHGGTIEIHLSEFVTHYVAERVALGCNKWWSMRQRGGQCKQYFVVTPSYVFECHMKNMRLPERYFLPEALRLNDGMVTLTQIWPPNVKRSSASEEEKPSHSDCKIESKENVDISSDVMDVVMDCMGTDATNERPHLVSENLGITKYPQRCFEQSNHDIGENTKCKIDMTTAPDHTTKENGSIAADIAEDVTNSVKDTKPKDKVEELPKDKAILDTFGVEEYYKHSRLHLLGTWRTNVEKEFDFEPFRPLKDGILKHGRILHIDMDAFFVSVALRNSPHLKDLPVAISHGTGRNSASAISTCNYAARAFGVKKGMLVKHALVRCPSLKFVGYDFDSITQTATQILKLVTAVTRKVCSSSCDELYMEYYLDDDEKRGGKTYMDFATEIANLLESETGCPLSVGMGGNMLLAKLASQRCKAIKHGNTDEIVGYVKRGSVCEVVDVEDFMTTVLLQELPSVGECAVSILNSCGYVRCTDVTTKVELQMLLGDKVGNTVYNFCQGLDFRDIYTAEKRSQILKNKSISSAINYGVRIKSMKQVHEYLKQLVDQTWERVETTAEQILAQSSKGGRTGVANARITLRLRVRSPEASVEPEKYMGCGICDEFSSSVDCSLLSQNTVFKSLLTCWGRIVAKQAFLLHDLRGISISIHRIRSVMHEEKNTIEKFLATSSPKSHDACYPYYRNDEESIKTPERTYSLTVGSAPISKGSILSFFPGSQSLIKTPITSPHPKRKQPKPYTLFDMMYLKSPASDSGPNSSLKQSRSENCFTVDSNRTSSGRLITPINLRDVPRIINIMPTISTLWLYRASKDLIKRRLDAIEKVWPMYKGVVIFYRKLFSNYSTILNGTCESIISHRENDECSNGELSLVANVEGLYKTVTNHTADTETNTTYGALPSLTATALTEIPYNGRSCSDSDIHEGGTGTHTPTRTKGESLGMKTKVTIFTMRRICKSCRERFYTDFDVSMLNEIRCPYDRCVLPRLKNVEPSQSPSDCASHAVAMVICILVYATLLRTVVQLDRQHRYDLLQKFINLSMHEAMAFSASFAGYYEKSIQVTFFSEAHEHLLKIYNMLGTPSVTHNRNIEWQ